MGVPTGSWTRILASCGTSRRGKLNAQGRTLLRIYYSCRSALPLRKDCAGAKWLVLKDQVGGPGETRTPDPRIRKSPVRNNPAVRSSSQIPQRRITGRLRVRGTVYDMVPFEGRSCSAYNAVFTASNVGESHE